MSTYSQGQQEHQDDFSQGSEKKTFSYRLLLKPNKPLLQEFFSLLQDTKTWHLSTIIPNHIPCPNHRRNILSWCNLGRAARTSDIDPCLAI
jgi:hypothetical protein